MLSRSVTTTCLAVLACATGCPGADPVVAGDGTSGDGGSSDEDTSVTATTGGNTISGSLDGGTGSGSGDDDSSSGDTSMMPTCADVTCDPNATCDDSSGEPVCICNDGWVGDGMTCIADECAMDPMICGAGRCVAEDDGGYTCDCPEGYVDDGTTCADIDECAEDPKLCDPNATCMNMPGTFECMCNEGLAGDGFTCGDLDECATDMDDCTSDELCLNEDGGFSCACLPGRYGMACELGTVLVYDDNTDEFHADTAATSLGYTVNLVTDFGGFNAAYDAGGFDLVIFDAPGQGLDAGSEMRLVNWVAGGGRLIFGAYNLNSFPQMQASLGVTVNSYNTARSIHLASGAVVDLYDQYDAVLSPLTTTRDANDNGDELTLTGAGVVLANLDDPTGPGAMVLTNEHRVVVNGFLPYDVGTADDDADGTQDMVEMYRNQINLVMNPRVLSFSEMGVDGAQTVARRLGWTTIPAADGPGFAAAYDVNLYELVVIDAPTVALPPEVLSRVLMGAGGTDRIVFSWWNLESEPMLETALGVTAVSFDMPREVYDDQFGFYDFFHVYQHVPDPLVPVLDAADNGHTCMLSGGGTVAATFDSEMGPGAICVTNGDRVVVNGFLPFDMGDADADGDTIPDMEELYENQFYRVLTP